MSVVGTLGSDQQWRALLGEQFSQNSRLLYRLAYGVLRNAAAAEDVCQQALLKAWERRAELRDAACLRSWLARVVVTESLQARRRGIIERRAMLIQSRQTPLENPGSPPSDLREGVLAAMQELPEQERLVVALRLMQGVSGNEVKELLGCSAGEVSKQLHRGMKMLRELLADWKPA